MATLPRYRPLRPRSSGRRSGDGGPSAATRLFALHELLAAGRRVDAAELSRAHEISARTIKRDIERLRDFHGAPIAWDPVARSYRYTAPFDLLTGLRLDADETLAVVLAGRTFAAWGESPLGRSLTSALGKVARFAGSAVSLPAADLRAALHHPETDDPAIDAEHRHFARLLDLVLARREVEIVYQKPSATRPERRRVRPLHLAYLDHRWMLVAEDPSRSGWRNFVLGRIRDIEPTNERFQAPPAEKIRAYLAGSLGRFTGEKTVEVVLRFDATAAPYVRERPWHGSQTLRVLPDGVVEITLRLNNLIDVQRRVLACGRHVEVLSPPELCASIAAELAALAQTYASEIAAVKKVVATENNLSAGQPMSHPTR
jgi:predicted DNA-binding transcriptional regulator YafY